MFVVVWCLVLCMVGVSVFNVTWSELLMISVYECQRVECAYTSPVRTECGMFVLGVFYIGRILFRKILQKSTVLRLYT